jgi:hypothetical protein
MMMIQDNKNPIEADGQRQATTNNIEGEKKCASSLLLQKDSGNMFAMMPQETKTPTQSSTTDNGVPHPREIKKGHSTSISKNDDDDDGTIIVITPTKQQEQEQQPQQLPRGKNISFSDGTNDLEQQVKISLRIKDLKRHGSNGDFSLLCPPPRRRRRTYSNDSAGSE